MKVNFGVLYCTLLITVNHEEHPAHSRTTQSSWPQGYSRLYPARLRTAEIIFLCLDTINLEEGIKVYNRACVSDPPTDSIWLSA